jgi:hypothetical protein
MRMRLTAAAVAIGIGGFAVSAWAGGAFKNKSFKGNYAIAMSGSDVSQSGACAAPPCAVALTGQISSNGSGKVTSGSVQVNIDSIACTGTVAKSLYGINNDGTGMVQLTISSGSCTNSATFPIGTLNLTLTLFNSGRQATLATQFTSPDGLVMSGSAASQNNIP